MEATGVHEVVSKSICHLNNQIVMLELQFLLNQFFCENIQMGKDVSFR
jgi:hypothetical protein